MVLLTQFTHDMVDHFFLMLSSQSMALLITTPKAWASTFAPPVWILILIKARCVSVFLSHDIPQRPRRGSPMSIPSIAATATAVSGFTATCAASSGLT